MGRVNLFTFPRDDAAFAAHAERAREAIGTADVDDFVERIRLAYPLTRVSPAMAGARLDPSTATWYVYRDGSIRGRRDGDAWADDPSLPRVFLGADGIYVDASDAAENLFGVPRDQIVGRPAGSFTRHEPDPALGDALLRVARGTGRLRSTAVVIRPDGEQWPIEFVVKPLRDDGHVVTMRRLG